MNCPNCGKESITRTKEKTPEELWECSECGWWHNPFHGLTGMRPDSNPHSENKKLTLVLGIVATLVIAGLLYLIVNSKREYVYRYFSYDGKCYMETIRVGNSRWQVVKQIPCSEQK